MEITQAASCDPCGMSIDDLKKFIEGCEAANIPGNARVKADLVFKFRRDGKAVLARLITSDNDLIKYQSGGE